MNKDFNFFFGCDLNPRRVGKYIPYNFNNEEGLKIKSINIFTKSSVENALFFVRIYKADSRGIPKILIKNKIPVNAKMGLHWTCVDVSNLNLNIPKSGLFIEPVWHKSKRNEIRYNCRYSSDLEKRKIHIEYTPSFGVLPSDKSDTWITGYCKWGKAKKINFNPKKYKNKYPSLIIRINYTLEYC